MTDACRITILATTDIHGQVDGLDDAGVEYRSSWGGDAKGLARIMTIAEQVRDDMGSDRVVLLDNGDALQGSQLDHWFAVNEPITRTGHAHPMATAFSTAGYDAQAVGNHDFNFGLEFLDDYARAAHFPVLGANVVDLATGEPVLRPFVLLTRAGVPGRPVRVGVLGLTTPGAAVWDRDQLAGRVRIDDMVSAAASWVPRVRAAGADILVLLAHAGIEGTSTTGVGPAENPVRELVARVPGIDVCVAGHTHLDIPSTWVTAAGADRPTLITQPSCLGHVVSRVDLSLQLVGDQWTVAETQLTSLRTSDVTDDPRLLDAVAPDLARVRGALREQIGTLSGVLDAARSRYCDTPYLGLTHRAQADSVSTRLAGGPHAGLPVVSLAAPLSRSVRLRPGPLTVGDAARVQPYEGTLRAVLLTGAALKRHLEQAAEFFATVVPGEAFDPDTMTGAQGIADYLYDTAWGVSYDIDLARPVGDRIRRLRWPDERPVDPAEQIAVAVSSYRSNGGGGYPDVTAAPVLDPGGEDVREILVGWIRARGVVDPGDLVCGRWRLTCDGVALTP